MRPEVERSRGEAGENQGGEPPPNHSHPPHLHAAKKDLHAAGKVPPILTQDALMVGLQVQGPQMPRTLPVSEAANSPPQIRIHRS